MDLQTCAVCAGVFIVCTIFVYLISVFGIRERSYEEAIAEQKKRDQEVVHQTKTEKGSKEKKKFKKWGRRVKEKGDKEDAGQEISVSSDEHHSSSEHVDFKPETEIIPSEIIQESKSGKQKKKSKQSAPAKSILVNKEELLPPAEPAERINRSNSFDVTLPKDDFELKHCLQKKEQVQIFEAAVHNAEPPSSKVIVEQAQHAAAAPSSAPKKAKKTKAETPDSSKITLPESEEITFPKLISLIKNLSLTDEEVQQIIDILLNKQGTSSQWTKKNDPMVTLKKQLQEREQALEVEQKKVQSANMKLNELRQELNQEKKKASVTERLHDQIGVHLKEIQNLKIQLQRNNDKSSSETASLHSQLKQIQSKCSEEHMAKIKNFQEEINVLQQKLTQRDSEVQKRIAFDVKHHQNEVDQQRANYETKIAQMGKAQEELASLNVQLEARVSDLMKSQNDKENKLKLSIQELTQKLKDADNLHSNELNDYKLQCSNLEVGKKAITKNYEDAQAKLEESQKLYNNVQNRVIQLETEISVVVGQKDQLKTQVDKLYREKEELESELAAATKRPAAEGEESVPTHENGGYKESEDAQSKIVRYLETKVKEAEEQVVTKQKDFVKMHGEAEELKKKNNELREKNWKVMDALTAAEKTVESKKEVISQKESELESTKDKLLKVQESERLLQERLKELESGASNWKNKMHQMQEQLEQKIQEAQKNATNLEQSRAKKVFEDKINLERSQVINVVQRIFPNIKKEESEDYVYWLQKFEKEALESSKQTPQLCAGDASSVEYQTTLSRLAEITEQKVKLEAEVQDYKTVLSETENILKKLQSSVESEEKTWTKTLLEKENELAEAKKLSDKLYSEKKTLESHLEQIQGIDEMQEKLKELQEKLQSEEGEKRLLVQKLQEASNTVVDLKNQLEDRRKEIDELKKEALLCSSLQKELEDAKLNLDKEKKTSKDLGSQNVKLNSLVKIGQDALEAEQRRTSQLQAELDNTKSNMTNGPPSSPAPVAATNEAEGASNKKS